MADSGGNTPPGTESHAGSGQDKTKAKATEETSQTANLPPPDQTASGSSSAKPPGQSRDESSKLAESASGSMQKDPVKNKNKDSMESRGQTEPTLHTDKKQGRFVKGVAQNFEQKHNSEQKEGEHIEEKQPKGKSTKTEIKSGLQKDNSKAEAFADKQDSKKEKLEICTDGKKDLVEEKRSDEKVVKQNKDQHLTGADGQQAQVSHTDTCGETTVEYKGLKTEDLGASFVLVSHLQSKNGNTTKVDNDRGMSDNSTRALDFSKSRLQEKTQSLHEKEEVNEDKVEQHASSKSPTVKSEFMRKHQDHSNDIVDNAAASSQKLGESNEHKADDKDKDDLEDEKEHKKESMQPTDHASVTPKEDFKKTAEDKGGSKHDDSAGMQIYVTKLNKEKILLDVERNYSVAKIKAMIKDESDIFTENWCLRFGREKLEDENKTLADYSILHGSSLIVFLPRKTGKKDQSVEREGVSTLEGQESKTGRNIQPGEPRTEGALPETDKGKKDKSIERDDVSTLEREESKTGGNIQPGEPPAEGAEADDSDEEGEQNYQNDFDESMGNPLQFTSELVKSKEIPEGLDLELECCVSKPDLKAEWSKDGHLLEVSERIKHESSEVAHSLLIKEVSVKDCGEYSVRIDGVKSASTVTVKEKPVTFSLSLKETVEAEPGKAVRLKCIISKPDLKAEWTFGDKTLQRSERIRLLSSAMEHSLSITNVVLEDAGEYCVQVGDAQGKTILNVLDKPSVPKDLTVFDITSGSCKLCWEKPENDGGSSITEYIVQWTEANAKKWSESTCSATESVIDGLKESTQYMFRVAARNKIGTGEFTAHTEHETKWSYKNKGSMNIKSGEPMLLEMKFKGQKPHKSYVRCLFNDSEHPDKNRTSIQITDSKIIFKLENVVPSDKGRYTLTAENKTGSGAVSAILNVLDKPSAPRNLTISDITSESCHLRWEKPDHENGSRITKYIVQMCETSEMDWKEFGSSTNTDIVINELQRKTQYGFRVAAENKVGIGAFGELQVSITTEDISEWKYHDENTVKVKCGDFIVLQVPFRGAKPSLSLLHNDGSVQNKERIKAEIKDSCVNCQLQEIDHADQGKYTLTVKNDTGRGTAVTTLIVLERPSPPQNLTASWTTTVSCKVNWQEPVDLGGSKIKEYIVEMYLREGEKYSRTNSYKCEKTFLNLKDLDSRNQYHFRVAAKNEVGIGEFTALQRLTMGKNVHGSENKHAESDSESIGSASDDDTYEMNAVQGTSLEQTSLVQPPIQAISMDTVYKATSDRKSQCANKSGQDNVEIELSAMFEQMSVAVAESKKGNEPNSDNEKGADQLQQKEDKGLQKVHPHFWNLNVNPALNRKLIHYALPGVRRVGNRETTPSPEILLEGSGISVEHAEIINKHGVVYIRPNASVKGILVNGMRIDSEIRLNHYDRVSFAPDELYVFHDPQVTARVKMDTPIFESAQEEIARQSRLIAVEDGTLNEEKTGTVFDENIEEPLSVNKRKVLGKKIKLPQFEEMRRKKYPKVKVNVQTVADQNDVQIVIKGPKHDAKAFFEFIDYEYSCNEISFKDVINGDEFDNIAELVEEHFRLLYNDEETVVWDINENYQRIGVCTSEEKQNNIVMREAKKCIVEEKIGIGKNTEVDNLELASELNKSLNENSKPFICIKAGCQKGVVAFGLKKYIDEELEGIKLNYRKLLRITEKENVDSSAKYAHGSLSQGQKAAKVSRTIHITHSAVFRFLSQLADLKRLLENNEISVQMKQTEKRQGFFCEGTAKQIEMFEKQLKILERKVVIMLLLVEVPDVSILNSLDEICHCIEREKLMKCDKLATFANQLSGGLSHYRKWAIGKHIIVVRTAAVQENNHELIIEFEESEGPCEHKRTGKTKIVPVPVWINGTKKEKDTLRKVFHQVLTEASSETDIVFIVKPLQSWKMNMFLKQLLFEVGDTASDISDPKCLSLCCINEELFKDTCEICESVSRKHNGIAGGITYQQATSIQDVPDQEDGVRVTIEQGDLRKTEADVLVNTISTDGNLSLGNISSKLLDATGPEMQRAIDRQKPIEIWKIYTTLNYKMNTCKYIFHGALRDYKKEYDSIIVRELQEFIYNCLKEANRLECHSIALPAIGTGALQYPPATVGKAVFLAVRRFNASYSTSSSLRVLKCVLYSEQLCKAFRDEQKRSEITFEATSNLVFGHVALCAQKKSLEDVTEDYVLYLWERKIMHSAKLRDHPLLKELDYNCRQEWCNHRHGHAKNEPFMTSTGNLSCLNIVHIPCEDTLPEIKNALAMGISMVTSAKGKSLAVYFDPQHPFLRYQEKLMEALVSTVTKSAPGVEYGLHAAFITPGGYFRTAAAYFKENKQTPTKVQQSPKRHITTLRMTGFKDDIDVAIQDIKRIKGLSLLEASCSQPESTEVVAPSEQSISRDGADTDTGSGSSSLTKMPVKWSKNLLHEIPEMKMYVYILNIPEDYNEVTLRGKVFTDDCPIGPSKLLYIEASGRALMICKSADDAQKLLGFNCEPFQFTQKKSIVGVSGYFNSDVWTAAKMKNEGENIKRDLQNVKVVLNEVTLEMKTLTLYQLQYAKVIENRYATKCEVATQSREKSASFGFENIDQEIIINNVSHLLWDLLKCKFPEEFDSFEKEFGKITFHEPTITLPIPKNCDKAAGFVNTLEGFVRKMKDIDIHEVPVEQNVDAVAAWCKEVDALEMPFCVLNKEKKCVYIVCDTYEEAMKMKHQLALKIGKMKPTGIGRRGGARPKVEEKNMQIDTSSEPNFKGSLRTRKHYGAENMQEFQADGGIKVYVYKADILKLQVDCIVNAANENLQHGGGVAAVIARAAGPSLTREGNEFIKNNGVLQVGRACVTTAGKLPYQCVVHTVGPAWSYYKPYTLQDVKRCEKDLYNAILNSFYEAEKKRLTSVALPAISSAIFAVPKELCVHQYAKATFDYCRKAKGVQGALQEIHFIDRDLDIVKKIQKEFQAFEDGNENRYDSTRFVKQFSHGRRHDRKVHSLKENTNVESDMLPEPLTFEDGWKSNAFYFLGNNEDSVIVCKKDMFDENAWAIVVPVDKTGKGGAMFASLTNKMPQQYHSLFKSSILQRIRSYSKLGDVALCPGYSCGFPFVLCVVYPYEARSKTTAQRKADLISAYTEIFQLADREEKIHSVLTPMFGIDSLREDELKLCAHAFLESYLSYCKQKMVSKVNYGSLKVKVVCQTDLAYTTVFNVLKAYVDDHKKEMDIKDKIPNAACGEDDVDDDYEEVGSPPQEGEIESCVICMDTLNVPKILPCGHKFCRGCIDQQFSFKKQCPTCGKVCGIITGDQPLGYMNWQTYRTSLSGYEGFGTIAITYNFPSGQQGENHPKPGKYYKGIYRTAYLPDNEEGRKIHKMLTVAFERKLVFTIGNSRTTGQEGVITWNDIHHKTDSRPHSQFGYPDPTYLDRVKEELAAKGVKEADIPKDTKSEY